MKRLKGIKTVIIIGMLHLLMSCAPGAVSEKGYVAWNYKPVETKIPDQANTRSIRLKLNKIMVEPPDEDWEMPRHLLKVIPILSVFASPYEMTNQVRNSWGGYYLLKDNELDRIVQKELESSNLFQSIITDNSPHDWEMNLNAELLWKQYPHQSGLGLLYIVVVPPFIVPAATNTFDAKLKVEIVDSTTKQIVLEKEYSAHSDHLWWMFYNFHQQTYEFGEYLIPRVMSDLIQDLNEVSKRKLNDTD
jgi:hypothetical protein